MNCKRASRNAWLYGIDHEDGRPKELKAELADSRQQFVTFVRKQTELTRSRMGLLAAVFNGSEYSCQVRVPAAYMIHRKNLRCLAFGYRNGERDYVREILEEPQERLDNTRIIRPFDELEI